MANSSWRSNVIWLRLSWIDPGNLVESKVTATPKAKLFEYCCYIPSLRDYWAFNPK